jgi:hypothetical protein
MKRQKTLYSAALVGMLLFCSQAVVAQSPVPAPGQPIPSPYPPGYNPYLQLINPGGSFTSNYFNLVYPQVRIQSNFEQLQQQSIDTRRGMQLLKNPVAGSSSKVGFNTHMKYFGSGSRSFGVNNTTNTNIRPPITDASLLKQYRPFPDR